MKSFYDEQVGESHSVLDYAQPDCSVARSRASVAVYDGLATAPYVEHVESAPARDYIEELSVRVYELAKQRGGSIPYTVIREIVENFIHAGFAEPVVSVLENGSTIRFSDQGPGIKDKERALLPGYTTANSVMKDVIRGVGSGLPLVREFLSLSQGSLSIEDNLGGGCVITVSTQSPAQPPVAIPSAPAPSSPSPAPSAQAFTTSSSLEQSLFTDAPAPQKSWLSTRQKQVLALVLENGTAGPSIVSRELGVGLSTAYRDLASLEDAGLIVSDAGKRTLTPAGISFISSMSTSR